MVQGEAIPGTRKTTDISLQVCPKKDQSPLVHMGAKSQMIREKRPVPAWTPDALCVCVCVCVVWTCVCVCVVWARSHAQVCRRTALTQAGAVCVCMCVCVCVCVFGAAVMVGGCECVSVCACVAWACSYEPVCGGTALTQAGARTRSAISPLALLAPALPFSFSKQWDGPKVRLG